MIGKRVTRSLSLLLILGVLLWLAWATSEDLAFNPASFEDEPLQLTVAPLDEALTLAQYLFGSPHSGGVGTLLVTGYNQDQVTGVELASLGVPRHRDPFAVAAAITPDMLARIAAGEGERIARPVKSLLPAAPRGTRHIGIGTNFPEHAQESNSDSVFNFPKFGRPTPARTSIATAPGDLLDYEVELCLRFDRAITSLADFDAAQKGVFLCADFTDRIALVKLADMDNLDSGYGFSDAKSGRGFFPTGPLLVIPKDWQQFIADVRMTTAVNGEPRQDARGGEMILNFRQLTEKVLGDMEAQRFLYDDAFYRLTPEGRIDENMALMSGTSEGVIFTSPARHDYIEIGLSYLTSGAVWGDVTVMDYARDKFIEREQASGRFLKAGDVVEYRSNVLGDIVVDVEAAER